MESNTDTSTISYDEEKELLWKMYGHIQGMIRHADQKAQSNLTLISILMAATLYVMKTQSPRGLYICLALIAVFLLFASMFLSIYVLVGRKVSHSESGHLFSFHAYASKSVEELEKALSMSHEEYLHDMLEELKEISIIAKEKYLWVNHAFYVLLAAAIVLLLSILCIMAC